MRRSLVVAIAAMMAAVALDRPAGPGRVPIPVPARDLAGGDPHLRVHPSARLGSRSPRLDRRRPRAGMWRARPRTTFVEPGRRPKDPARRARVDQPATASSSALEGAAVLDLRDRHLLRQRDHRDAPAAGDRRPDLRRPAAASSGPSPTTGRRRRTGSSTSTARTSSGSAAARRGRAPSRSPSRSTDAALALDWIPISEPVP